MDILATSTCYDIGRGCKPEHGYSFVGTGNILADVPSEEMCCMAATSGEIPDVKGYSFEKGGDGCTLYSSITGKKSNASATSSKITPPASGSCLLYSKMNGSTQNANATSGGAKFNPTKPKLYPSWPASSPWVTSVGATRFIKQSASQPEMASDEFGSAGGFSTMFEAFAEQAEVVKHYLESSKELPPKGSYPPGGRATPDVAAMGEGYQVFVNGELQTIGGTSASTPLFAGMVSLLNEARLKAGKPAMGCLNKFLYQNSDAFTDITEGTNSIDRGGEPLRYGFPCAKGWDPATGLGTPQFSKLLAAALKAGSNEVVV